MASCRKTDKKTLLAGDSSRRVVPDGDGCKPESTDMSRHLSTIWSEKACEEVICYGPETRGDSCPFSRSVRCSSPSAVCRESDDDEVLADTYQYAQRNASGGWMAQRKHEIYK